MLNFVFFPRVFDWLNLSMDESDTYANLVPMFIIKEYYLYCMRPLGSTKQNHENLCSK